MLGKVGFDEIADRVGTLLVNEDLDARLVLVVASAFEIVDAQDRVRVGEQIRLRQKFTNSMRNQRRTALSSTNIYGESDVAVGVPDDLVADVMHLDRRAIMGGAVYRDLELARQEREFRVQRRPLTQDLSIGTRILDLVGGGAGKLVRRGVADAVARGLDGVHLDAGEFIENGGAVGKRRPVELQVLAGGEVPVALVVDAGDVRELAHLLRGQRAVGHGNPQHIGVKLQVDAVHQTQRPELFLGQGTGKAALDLIAKLRDPFGDKSGIKLIITIHGACLQAALDDEAGR